MWGFKDVIIVDDEVYIYFEAVVVFMDGSDSYGGVVAATF